MFKLISGKLFFSALALYFLLPATLADGQSLTNYTPLTSSGNLPDEFLKTARMLSVEELAKVGYGKDRTAKQQFIMSSNFLLKDILLSGSVLINDPLGAYVNKVADELLKSEPELRKSIHIYVIKSSSVNAHAFDKGFIFINVGLLAQLENEAQLAFILAHEITHIRKKHSVNAYLENVRLENGTSEYERGSYEARNLAKYRYSKENESEADSEGLELLKNSGYSIKTVNGALDVLQYSYLPFELVDFEKSFFEDGFLILPDTAFLKKTADVNSDDNYDDTKSTHPNIRKRRAALEPELKAEDEAKRKKYLVSEDEFKKAREISRFELCRIYMLERDYVNAIYASYILLQKAPDNIYLKKTIARALHNIVVNKSSADRNALSMTNAEIESRRYEVPDYRNIEGESQRLYYMLENLDARELNTVALSYTYRAHKKHPEDVGLKALSDSLFSEMVKINNLYLSSFSTKTKSEVKSLDTIKVVEVDTTVEESKYSKIKKKLEKVEVNTDDNFTKYAFVGLMKDKEFEDAFSLAARQTKKEDEEEDFPKLSVAEQRKLEKERAKEENKRRSFLGLEKVILVDPFYLKYTIKYGNEIVDFFECEDKQKALLDMEKKSADFLKLNYQVLSTKDLTATDIEIYNDNALLNEWLLERLNYGDNRDETGVSSENIQQLIDKYATKYVAWSGVYNRKGKVYRNKYFFIVLNLENGQIVKYESRITKSRDSADIVRSFVYNSMFHIAKK